MSEPQGQPPAADSRPDGVPADETAGRPSGWAPPSDDGRPAGSPFAPPGPAGADVPAGRAPLPGFAPPAGEAPASVSGPPASGALPGWPPAPPPVPPHLAPPSDTWPGISQGQPWPGAGQPAGWAGPGASGQWPAAHPGTHAPEGRPASSWPGAQQGGSWWGAPQPGQYATPGHPGAAERGWGTEHGWGVVRGATAQPLPWWQPGQVPPARRKRLAAAWIGVFAVVALVSGLLGGLVGEKVAEGETGYSGNGPAIAAPDRGTLQRAPASIAGVAGRVLPSVVAIRVTADEGEVTGSGFVVRQDGYIVSNAHVVAPAEKDDDITVVFENGSHASAKVVGRDASYDLAVLKVDRRGLPALPLGDSDTVRVGDPVIAIGSPLGLQGTVTTGIVSALNRPVTAGEDQQTSYINAIQTDAAINPGNSGGPLVDATGRVIGVNSAMARAPGTASGGSIGLGFAIPSKQAQRTADQLIRTGKAEHPIVGVLLDHTYTGEGVRVARSPQNGAQPVTPGGPADRAGIEPGDVVLALDGRPVTNPEELIVAIRAKAPGDVVKLTVRRSGRERTVSVTLAAAAED